MKGLLFLLFCIVLIQAQGQKLPVLKISENQKYIVTQDNQPFFGWEVLIHRCTKEEIDQYLTDRADKTFTVIQTVILVEL